MIALDLDNTIICYDEAFRAAAEEVGCLPASGGQADKSSVKTAALAAGGNDLWTRVQGIAYGEGISSATLFPGCMEFIHRALQTNVPLAVFSHKTEYPAIGPRVNLRIAAMRWMEKQGLPAGDQLPVNFCDSREVKVARIATSNCRALLDDLPEVLLSPGFPSGTLFVLFDPSGSHADWSATPRVASWQAAADLLLGGAR